MPFTSLPNRRCPSPFAARLTSVGVRECSVKGHSEMKVTGGISHCQGGSSQSQEYAGNKHPDLFLPCSDVYCDSCRLDGKFVELLQAVLCSPKSPEQIQMLCAAILREMSPCNDLILSCDEIQDTKLLSLVSSVLLAQVNDLSSQRSSLVNMDLLFDCSLLLSSSLSSRRVKINWKYVEKGTGISMFL